MIVPGILLEQFGMESLERVRIVAKRGQNGRCDSPLSRALLSRSVVASFHSHSASQTIRKMLMGQ